MGFYVIGMECFGVAAAFNIGVVATYTIGVMLGKLNWDG